MNAKSIAKWFIYKNPELAYNYENMKLNKLLYFSQLYHFVLFGKNLFEDNFLRWDNGPVIESIYKDYRYNDLKMSVSKNELDKELLNEPLNKFLNLINFMFSTSSGEELSEETHTHNIWKDINKNEIIDFKNISSNLIKEINTYYNFYKDIDFDKLVKLEIGNNIFYHLKDENLNEEDKNYLKSLNYLGEIYFIEKINGELVFS